MARKKKPRTADIVVLPGVERRDLCGPAIPVAQVFACAIDAGITDVVIVGRDRSGQPYIAGSLGDLDKAAGMLLGAATQLVCGDYARSSEPKESK